jgi:hypothetical protein
VLRINEKYIQEFYIFNVLGFILTTNHKTDGIFLPADDRRHYVAWSDRKKEDFAPGYWDQLWGFYADRGLEHVAAYLTEFDLSSFNPKAPPPKTSAFWDIVNVNLAPEEAELRDALDQLGGPDKNDPNVVVLPDTVTITDLLAKATGGLAESLMTRSGKRALPHQLERCGYVSVRNPKAKDGLWKINGARQVVYAKASLAPGERVGAARRSVGSLTG